jgi:hypothetical protein
VTDDQRHDDEPIVFDPDPDPGEPPPLRVSSTPRRVEVDIEEAEFVEEFPSVYDELYGAAGVAGLPAVPAAPGSSPASYAPPLSPLQAWQEKRRKRHLGAGMGLIGLGLVLFVLLLLDVSIFGVAVAAMGAFALMLAVVWPVYPFLITGFALAGFGAGWIVDDLIDSPMHLSLAGLGVGLLTAFFVQLARHRHPRWGVPAVGAVLLAWGVLAGLSGWWSILGLVWPLAIVAIGVAVVAKALRGRR